MHQTDQANHPVNLLDVKELSKHFLVRRKTIKAVDGVSFTLKKGETLALVGESGCGKTTLGKTILQLYESDGGEIWFDGTNLTGMPKRQLNPLRRRLQIVFQDPYASLNPALSVYQNVVRGLKIHKLVNSDKESRKRVSQLLQEVGLSSEHLLRFPHEFSGGQRQRIAIARALAVNPDLIVLDEPTSALDVSVQAQILNLLKNLQKVYDFTYLLITHDLVVARHISERIGVMYYGQLVELANTEQIFVNPQHPYTKVLLSSIPPAAPWEKIDRILLRHGEKAIF